MIRGWGQPLTPSRRRRCATASKLALRVCRTRGFVHTFLSANTKGPEAGPFLLAEREGLIRGWRQPLTPSRRRRCATASKLALRVCRTRGFVHTFLSANREGPEAGPFLLAEREGFEPSMGVKAHTPLAGERLRPARPPLRRERMVAGYQPALDCGISAIGGTGSCSR